MLKYVHEKHVQLEIDYVYYTYVHRRETVNIYIFVVIHDNRNTLTLGKMFVLHAKFLDYISKRVFVFVSVFCILDMHLKQNRRKNRM